MRPCCRETGETLLYWLPDRVFSAPMAAGDGYPSTAMYLIIYHTAKVTVWVKKQCVFGNKNAESTRRSEYSDVWYERNNLKVF